MVTLGGGEQHDADGFGFNAGRQQHSAAAGVCHDAVDGGVDGGPDRFP